MLDTRVTINGVKGYVTVDHQDGTYTVNMEDHTIYLATIEELQPKVEKVERKLGWYDCHIANTLINSLSAKKKHSYKEALKFLKQTCGINAYRQTTYQVIDILNREVLKANGWA